MSNYFSYFPGKSYNPMPTVFKTLFADLFVSILCGLVLFPVIFTYSNTIINGTGLLFITSVTLLNKIFMGKFLMIIFFLFVLFVGINASLSLIQFSSRSIETVFHLSERKSLIIHTIILLLL